MRHGSLRRLGHAGRSVGIATSGTTGSFRLEGICGVRAMATCAVAPGGWVSSNDQIGCEPFGADTTTRIRDPAR